METNASRATALDRAAASLLALTLGVSCALASNLGIPSASLAESAIYGAALAVIAWWLSRSKFGPHFFRRSSPELDEALRAEIGGSIDKNTSLNLVRHGRAMAAGYVLTARRTGAEVVVEAEEIDISSTWTLPKLIGGSGAGADTA